MPAACEARVAMVTSRSTEVNQEVRHTRRAEKGRGVNGNGEVDGNASHEGCAVDGGFVREGAGRQQSKIGRARSMLSRWESAAYHVVNERRMRGSRGRCRECICKWRETRRGGGIRVAHHM